MFGNQQIAPVTALSWWFVVALSVIACGGSTAYGQHAHGRTNEGGVRSTQGPAVLVNESARPGVVEVRLTAAPARLSLIEGVETNVFAFNGRIPGPMLDVREGDSVIVHFRNDLPEESTVHWHGLHLPVDSDGSPLNPVPPGGERIYAFRLLPGSAGSYWYHPHPHHRTGYQVAKGLYGGIIVRDPADPLPPELTERYLILSDNRFQDDGSLDISEPHSHHARIDFENGREGSIIFVNGEVMPELMIRSGEIQRWRILNASAGRYYRLHVPGHTLLQVGSDGGLFERPIEVNEILLASAERVEVLVRGTAEPGSRVVVESLPYDRYIRQTRPADWAEVRKLFVLAYSDDPPIAPLELPATLRRIDPIDTAQAAVTRTMVLSQGFINGLPMDMERVDAVAHLGSTEIWEIENIVGMDHPFHLHGFQFQVIDRDGVPEPFPSWKDTVNVPRHGIARFVVRFDNHPGKWMFHCHILDHEDHGMMGILEVVAPDLAVTQPHQPHKAP
jgi:FtsP/CotA-like multicopper oxidase with cupredoxin domain